LQTLKTRTVPTIADKLRARRRNARRLQREKRLAYHLRISEEPRQ